MGEKNNVFLVEGFLKISISEVKIGEAEIHCDDALARAIESKKEDFLETLLGSPLRMQVTKIR